MKIGIVGPIWHNIPPKGYGGTELVVYNLVNALAKTDDVTLFGPKTAQVDSKLIATVESPLNDKEMGWGDIAATLRHITIAFDMADQFDVLHVHLNRVQDYFAIPLSISSKTPVVFTPHFLLPSESNHQERALILDRFKFLPFVSISDNQRKDSSLNFLGTAYNGIDLAEFEYSDTSEDYFVWIGKLIPTKGAKEAILASKQAGVKLVLIGPVDQSLPNSVEYYEKEIKPLIDGEQIVWEGELGEERKMSLISKAKAVINPIKWEEPFGMVMIESMAVGTPVIAFNRGSVSEIVVDGKNGYIVENIDQLVEKIKEVGSIERSEVRKQVEKFSALNMATSYKKYYSEAIDNWQNYLKSNKI